MVTDIRSEFFPGSSDGNDRDSGAGMSAGNKSLRGSASAPALMAGGRVKPVKSSNLQQRGLSKQLSKQSMAAPLAMGISGVALLEPVTPTDTGAAVMASTAASCEPPLTVDAVRAASPIAGAIFEWTAAQLDCMHQLCQGHSVPSTALAAAPAAAGPSAAGQAWAAASPGSTRNGSVRILRALMWQAAGYYLLAQDRLKKKKGKAEQGEAAEAASAETASGDPAEEEEQEQQDAAPPIAECAAVPAVVAGETTALYATDGEAGMSSDVGGGRRSAAGDDDDDGPPPPAAALAPIPKASERLEDFNRYLSKLVPPKKAQQKAVLPALNTTKGRIK